MSQSRNSKRTQPQQCANPIFELWISEWREDAVSKNSKLQYVYSKALASLRKYPLPLGNGRECLILEYFGPSLCQKIDLRMTKEPHLFPQDATRTATVIDLTASKAKKSKIQAFNSQDEDEQSQPTTSKKKKKRDYIPVFRSGAYALLVTLFKKETMHNYRGYMLKSELQQEAQEHTDNSLTSNSNGQYTAWNSMTTLIRKDLVIKKSNPPKYLLTVEGRELAAKLLNADQPNAPTSSQSQTESDNDEAEVVISPRVRFEPGEFEVLLCVDTSETNAKSKKDEVLGELRKNGVPLEVVRLNVGDFVWICRKVQGMSAASTRRLTISRSSDMILPYVVERKRTDDLASSIKDGRFHEQKHRLEQTGLQPIYLIESYGTGDWGLANGALMQAVANTQITNRFMIHETDSLKDTCAYLTLMTRHLAKMYQGKSISSCTKEEWPIFKTKSELTYLLSFSDFNEFGTKSRNWTVSEMFARHLMKMKGLSADRAVAIIQKYPTVAELLRAYRDCCTASERDSLLSLIRFGTGARNIGQSISKAIHSLYSAHTLS